MILYYAVGGGLGHLTRAAAAIYTLGLGPGVKVLTASHTNADRILGNLPCVIIPSQLETDPAIYRLWLTRMFEVLQPEAIYMDAFAVGIVGEFCDFEPIRGIPVDYVARRLRWGEYEKLLHGALPLLRTTYRLEPLEAAHETFIQSCSQQVKTLSLVDPPSAIDAETAARLHEIAGDRPLWLVVHSGPPAEVMELVRYAEETAQNEHIQPVMIVISPSPLPTLPAHIRALDIYPAAPLFPLAHRIITGCGFNIMRQMGPFRLKHWFIPFPRRYDDQFWRAAIVHLALSTPEGHSQSYADS